MSIKWDLEKLNLERSSLQVSEDQRIKYYQELNDLKSILNDQPNIKARNKKIIILISGLLSIGVIAFWVMYMYT